MDSRGTFKNKEQEGKSDQLFKSFTYYAPKESGSFLSETKLAFIDFYYLANDKLSYFFKNFAECCSNTWEKMKKSDTWQLVGVLSLVAVLCYLYSLLVNNFVYAAGGDYSIQGIAFIYNGYDDWHYYFNTGIFPFWDSSNLMGNDNIYGSAFYYLFDPFFLFLLIWPRAWLNNIQSLLQMVKLVLAGLFFYKYMSSFPKVSKNARKMGAVAYAFCGWGWFFLWFFHMQEVVTFLPLMLWGVEKIVQKKDPRLMTVAMFLMGATNYQFLAIMTVFCFLYAITRVLQTLKDRTSKETWKVLFMGFICFLTGICLCAFIILPSYYGIQSMPRLNDTETFSNQIKTILANTELSGGEKFSKVFDLCFKWPDKYKFVGMYPLMGLIFMNNNSFSMPLVRLSNYGNIDGNAGSSLYCSSIFLLLIIPSLIDAIKKKQWSQPLIFLFFILLLETPFTYYASGGFGKTAYGRWVIFPSAMLVMFITTHIDSLKKMPKWNLDVSFLTVAILFFVVVTQAYSWNNITLYHTNTDLLELTKSFNLFGIMTVDLYKFEILFQGIWIFVCYIALRVLWTNPIQFNKKILFLIGADMVIMGNISIQGQGITSSSSFFNGRDNYYEQTKIVQALNKYDTSSFRLFNTQSDKYSAANLGMAEGYNSLGIFSSTIDYAATQSDGILCWSKIAYNTGSYFESYFEKRRNLDELMGIKYYLLKATDTNIPYGFVDVTTLDDCPDSLKSTVKSDSNPTGQFKLYENNNYIDTFFAFDNFIDAGAMKTYSGTEADNEINYLRAALIDNDTYKENSEELSQFASTSTKAMDFDIGINTSTTSIYSVYWEYPSGGNIKAISGVTPTNTGTVRTFSTSESDAQVSVDYQDQLNTYYQANKNNSSCLVTLDNEYQVAIQGHEGENLYHYKLSDYVGNGYPIPGSVKQSGSTYGNGLNWNSQIIIQGSGSTPTPIAASEASSKNGAYVTLSYYFANIGSYLDTYLYGYDTQTKTYHLIQYDNHLSCKSNSGSWKSVKGFYVDEPVYKIEGVVRGTGAAISLNSVQYEYNTDYMTNVDALKAKAATITYQDANTVKYTSNYTSPQIVVVNKTYNEGWNLTRTDESGNTTSVKTFKIDGGMLGYVAPAGEQNYVLAYYSKGFSTGINITNLALAAQGAMYYLWYASYFRRKDLESMKKAFSLKGL